MIHFFVTLLIYECQVYIFHMLNIKEKIRIYEAQRVAYIPKVLIERGFVGDVPYLTAPSALVFALPGSTLEQVEDSLKHIREELEMRRAVKG